CLAVEVARGASLIRGRAARRWPDGCDPSGGRPRPRAGFSSSVTPRRAVGPAADGPPLGPDGTAPRGAPLARSATIGWRRAGPPGERPTTPAPLPGSVPDPGRGPRR